MSFPLGNSRGKKSWASKWVQFQYTNINDFMNLGAVKICIITESYYDWLIIEFNFDKGILALDSVLSFRNY